MISTKYLLKAAFIAVFLCLAGCSAVFSARIQDESSPPVSQLPVPKYEKYLIELNLLRTTAELRTKCAINYAMACAIPGAEPCLIYAIANNFDGFIVHEIRHCTNGYWHKKLEDIH